MPGWVTAMLGWPALEWLARLALASPFLASGIMKLLDFPGAVAEVRALTGIEPAGLLAALVILVQLGGSGLFLTRSWCWLGAGLLAGFTVAATLLAHPFWAFPPGERIRQATTFLEHAAIVGGLAAAAILASRTAAS